jgi:hypothetical protein
MTSPEQIPPDVRLAAIRARKAARKAVRAEFAVRRQYGLEYRHAQRLHNLDVARDRADRSGEPP